MTIDQRWLDDNCYADAADLEPELNDLAEQGTRLADLELLLISTIRRRKRQLGRLPEIIRGLETRQQSIGRELTDVFECHDKLTAAHKLLTAKQHTGPTTVQQPAEVESGPQFPFPYRCTSSECDGMFMEGPGVLPGDICPICSFGRIVNAEVEA